jgi:hypothetical protein
LNLFQAAAVGEVYNAASMIDESRGAASWIAEWSAEGERVMKLAEKINAEI